MGIFDFLKHDKKKAAEAAEKAQEQIQQQAAPGTSAASPPVGRGTKYTDAAEATKAAAERMAASAPPKSMAAPGSMTPPKPMTPPHKVTHTPTPTSAAHKAVPAAPEPPSAKKRVYTVRPGDSLSAIARRELGNEGRWRELYAMNRAVIGPNPDMIRPGMVLTLPH
jgi:nucleoid-associated protein YgaU